MKKKTPKAVFRKLAALYKRMAEAYAETAAAMDHSCEGCRRNCCTSFFQHHTYVEWAYLWQGLNALPAERRDEYVRRAHEYVDQARIALNKGERPAIMCPLNDDGLCGVYEHRLMICRMHGVPNVLRTPDGKMREFPGCWLSQELAAGMPESEDGPPRLDRTELYKGLVNLEMELLGSKIRQLPRVDMTLAEMLVLGPPKI